MKTITLFTLLALCAFKPLFALDRIVQESGAGGAYTNISAALLASVNDDRILIYPRGGDNPYLENLAITKRGIRIQSAVKGKRFTVKGNLTNTTAATTVVVSGAVIYGNITYSGDGLRVLGSTIYGTVAPGAGLTSKNLYLDNDSIIPTVNVTYPAVQLYKGRVSGCYITAPNTGFTYGISVLSAVPASTETVYIVGNKLLLYYAKGGIRSQTTGQFIQILNNYINITEYEKAIQIDSAKNSVAGQNACNNNTILETHYSPRAGIYCHIGGTATMDIFNNVVKFRYLETGLKVFDVAGNVSVRYNCSNAFTSSGVTHNPTNHLDALNLLIDEDNGQLLVSSDGINEGCPGTPYTDIDLTVNDAGCYGGSYSKANFNVAAPYAQVLYMTAPREVMLNQTFSISADGLAK